MEEKLSEPTGRDWGIDLEVDANAVSRLTMHSTLELGRMNFAHPLRA
jgi:hypothetical protein